jgi:transcriptional regulator with XRE-family HTH domain
MVGVRIAFLRIGKGWSQAELAQRIGSNARTVYLYERKLQQPSSDDLLRFAQAFGVTTEYLLTGETQQVDSTAVLETPPITVRAEALIQYLSTTSE